MIAMPQQTFDIPDPQQSHSRETWPTEEMTAAASPRQRPDASILRDAIPLFSIGRNSDSFWVARESKGRIGGIFLCKGSALRFVKRCAGQAGYALMFLSETCELDIENEGNLFVAQISAIKRLMARLARTSFARS